MFIRYRFNNYWSPIKDYFDDWEAAKAAVANIARNDPLRSEYCMPNLISDGFMDASEDAGKKKREIDQSRPSRNSASKRE